MIINTIPYPDKMKMLIKFVKNYEYLIPTENAIMLY
jgi:hypothetical protein